MNNNYPMTLVLAPDEMLPGTPAPAEGEVWLGPIVLERRHQKRRFCFRLVELLPGLFSVFARDVEQSEAGNWVVNSGGGSLLMMERAAPRREGTTRKWAQFPQLGRLFILPIDKPDCLVALFLRENGTGAWLDSSLTPAHFGSFGWTFDSHLFETNRVEVKKWVQRELDDPNSAISFARRWATLSNDARIEKVFTTDLAEVQQMMHWTLFCDSSLWAHDGVWSWRLKRQDWPFDVNDGFLHCKRTGHIENPALQFPLIFRVSQFLIENYIPRIIRDEALRHLGPRELLAGAFRWLGVDANARPTSHEQLEAALALRQWLRANNAPAGIEALIP